MLYISYYNYTNCLSYVHIIFLVLEVEPRASYILNKCSITILYTQINFHLLFWDRASLSLLVLVMNSLCIPGCSWFSCLCFLSNWDFRIVPPGLIWYSLFFRYIYCILCICMSHLHVCVCTEVPWNWSYWWFWATMWVLEIESGSFGRADNDLNHWAIAPAPHLYFLPLFRNLTSFWVWLILFPYINIAPFTLKVKN